MIRAAMTMAEQLLSRSARRMLREGDTAVCEVDQAMGTDASVPMALDYLQQMQPAGAPLPPPARPEWLVFAFDHYDASSGDAALALQQRARSYARAHGVEVFEAGQGIGHQLMLERGRVLPGRLVVGADSHAVTYGALNAFGTGIGSSDLAGVLQCHQVWLRVPPSLRVVLHGALPHGSSAKDVALHLARRLGAAGANYCAVEFGGEGVATLDIDDRIVLANMAVEMGAKAGLFAFDACTAAYLDGRTLDPATGRATEAFEPVQPHAEAAFARTLEVDLSTLQPQIALPHRADQVIDLHRAAPTPIDMVYLGTCTGGRTKDYRQALQVLRAGGGVAPGVRLVVAPASEAVRTELQAQGLLAQFAALGAEIRAPGCAGCCGTCGTAPADGARVMSTANRNFKGRMGNREAQIFLASPAACAAAAVCGRVTDPRELMS